MKKKQRMREARRKRRILFTVLAVCILCLCAVLGGIKLKQAYDQKQEEKARIAAEEERKRQQEAEERRWKIGKMCRLIWIFTVKPLL